MANDLLAQEALTHYDVGECNLVFLRHNENLTYRVDAAGRRYALRIHCPQPGFSMEMLDCEHTGREMAEGEAQLLIYLSDRADFPMQRPVLTRAGDRYCTLSGGELAILLQWVDGDPLDGDCAGYAPEMGRLAAKLHRAAAGFNGARYRYSHGVVRNMDSSLRGAEILPAQLSSCLAALEEIDKVMDRLDGEEGAMSLIHADLGLGNLLRTPGGGLAPIDFSMSGYGYRAQECGMLASNFRDPAQWEEIRLAYREESGISVRRYDQDAFLAMSVLLFIAAQHARYAREEWFARRMDAWCGGLFRCETWRNG